MWIASSPYPSSSPVLCLGLLSCQWHYSVTGGITVVSYCVQFTVFLEQDAEGSLNLPNVAVSGVVITCDVVGGAAQFILGSFFFGM